MRQTPTLRSVPVLLLLTMFLTGCKTPNTATRYSASAVAFSGKTQSSNGLRITVDPIFDEARSREYFGTDALGHGILPIGICAENTNPEASFLLQKTNLQFQAGSDDRQKLSAAGVDVHSSSGKTIGAVGSTLLSSPLVAAAVVLVFNAVTVQHNLVQAELRDQTLSPGGKAFGFVYYKFDKKQALSGGVLHARVPDLQTQEDALLKIPLVYEKEK